MNYSAGMVSQVFAFVETKQTAELMATGMSKDEVHDKVIGENLYQLRNETRLRRTFNYVYNRLSSLPDGAVELLVKVDNENAKLLTLIAIMNTDKLFFEFVYEVYRGKVILGEKTIEDRDINGFFDDKAAQSEEVAGWSESGIKKLKSCYMKNLADAGLIESTNTSQTLPAPPHHQIHLSDLQTSHGLPLQYKESRLHNLFYRYLSSDLSRYIPAYHACLPLEHQFLIFSFLLLSLV